MISITKKYYYIKLLIGVFQVMQQRAQTYGPIYKEKIGPETLVTISDPKEYLNVMRVDGKYPNRPAVEPILHYQKKRGITLGIINGYYKLIKIKIILVSLFFQ